MKLSKDKYKAQRQETLKCFNPDENGISAHGVFGLPFSVAESRIVLMPVPWEVTVSYGEGTANGPAAILKASQQIDLHDPLYPGGWRAGIAMENTAGEWLDRNHDIRPQSALYLQEYETTGQVPPHVMQVLSDINNASEELNEWVKSHTDTLMGQGKFIGIVGGEHSVPLGYMQALSARYGEFGILQIDAHADLRQAYEGFTYSHASIMYNALKDPAMTKLVQVGIRDMSQGENEIIKNSDGRIALFDDHRIKKAQYEGSTWKSICDNIISELPEQVYISFDIDGLHPWLCPNTGTPVPGGLLLEEAFYLLEKLTETNRTIIGFDLCEVAPGADEWDGNVGARVLYKLCMLAAKCHRMAE